MNAFEIWREGLEWDYGGNEMSWYADSMGWIKKQKIDNPDLSHDELRKHCSKNYPFSRRTGYAYKAFLEAMRDQFGSARKKKIKGQSELF